MANKSKTNIGRPRTLESVEQFEERFEAYLEQCKKDSEPLTIVGLALAVGLSCRQKLHEYEKIPEFRDPVRRAMSFVEREYEKRLFATGSTGAIFALKCNYKWRDTDPDSL